jgi:hypothetical protein
LGGGIGKRQDCSDRNIVTLLQSLFHSFPSHLHGLLPGNYFSHYSH